MSRVLTQLLGSGERLYMMRIDFFELFSCFLDHLTFEEIDVLGLPSLDPDALKRSGYEIVGYEEEFHAYEKIIYAPYKNRSVSLLHKLYFYGESISGSGLSVEPKIRLTTLLKEYWARRGLPKGSLRYLDFYFWEGRQDGAVVIEGNLVVRFGQRQNKGAYLIRTVESNLDKTGSLHDVAVNTVKECMELYVPDFSYATRRDQDYPRALLRLLYFLCKK